MDHQPSSFFGQWPGVLALLRYVGQLSRSHLITCLTDLQQGAFSFSLTMGPVPWLIVIFMGIFKNMSQLTNICSYIETFLESIFWQCEKISKVQWPSHRVERAWESYEGNPHKPKVCTRGWSSGCVLMQSIWQFSLMIAKTIHLLGCTWQQLVKVSWWSAAISVRWNSKCVHGAPFWFVALNLTPKGLMDIAWCVDFDCQGRDPGTSLNNLFRSHQTWSEITKATHVIRHGLCGIHWSPSRCRKISPVMQGLHIAHWISFWNLEPCTVQTDAFLVWGAHMSPGRLDWF